MEKGGEGKGGVSGVKGRERKIIIIIVFFFFFEEEGCCCVWGWEKRGVFKVEIFGRCCHRTKTKKKHTNKINIIIKTETINNHTST